MKKRMLLMGALACMGLASAGRAAVIYSYVAQTPGNVPMTVGTNTIDLFLQETLTNSSPSFIAANGGLYSGGVAFIEEGGSGVTATGAASNSATEPGGFTGNNHSNYFNAGTLDDDPNIQVANSAPPPSTVPLSITAPYTGAYITAITNNSAVTGVAKFSSITSGTTTTNLFLLGTVTLNVANHINAKFDVESLRDAPGPATSTGFFDAGSNGNTLTFNTIPAQYDLDQGGVLNGGVTGANSPDPSSLFVIATPEPHGLAPLGVLAVSALAFRRRRVVG